MKDELLLMPVLWHSDNSMNFWYQFCRPGHLITVLILSPLKICIPSEGVMSKQPFPRDGSCQILHISLLSFQVSGLYLRLLKILFPSLTISARYLSETEKMANKGIMYRKDTDMSLSRLA